PREPLQPGARRPMLPPAARPGPPAGERSAAESLPVSASGRARGISLAGGAGSRAPTAGSRSCPIARRRIVTQLLRRAPRERYRIYTEEEFFSLATLDSDR